MPVANVKSKWEDGNLVFYDKSGNEIFTVDGQNRKLTFPTGSEFELQAGATADIADILLEAGDVALADGKILVGNGSGAAAAVDVSGDATIANTGALTLTNGIVRTVTVDVDAGAGGSGQTDNIFALPANSVVHEVHVRCTEDFDGDTTQDFAVGVSGTASKYIASTDFENGADDINAADEAFASALGSATAPVSVPSGETIIATWTNDGSATTGIVRVSVTYHTEDI